MIIVDSLQRLAAASIPFEASDYKSALRMLRDTESELDAIKPGGGLQESQKYISLFVAYHMQGRAEYLQGDYSAAERSERASLDARLALPMRRLAIAATSSSCPPGLGWRLHGKAVWLRPRN